MIATIIILATKSFFPHHRVIALVVYLIGWIPFLYSVSQRKKWLLEQNTVITSFLQAYWIHIVFGIILLIVLYIFLTLFPPVKSPFIGLSDEEISIRLDEDKTVVMYLNERLENELKKAKEDKLFDVDFKNISGEEKLKIENAWVSYVDVLFELDLLKERYKSFYQLSSVTKRDLHRKAFENGFASFLSQHLYTLELVKTVQDPNVITFLNQSLLEQGIQSGTFDMLQDRVTDADELLRINTGRAYYKLIKNDKSELNSLIDNNLEALDNAAESYTQLFVDKPLKFLEKNSFDLWFPIQKQAAIQISYVRTSNRDYHITPKVINKYKDLFVPGDVLLERREWHATNVGIPGFWTHGALYIGTLEQMNEYFNDIPELKGLSFEEYLKGKNTKAYESLRATDDDGYNYAVIEAKRPGVILTSLEYTTNADSLSVLRVKGTTVYDHFKIVTQALSHLGKPYDFDFNFVTDDALVCSELVYKAYNGITQLNIEPQKFNGRTMVAPNQFAEKFAHEYGKKNEELELILFLDGNEKQKTATEKGADVFVETWQRPKWHIVKDFVDTK